MRGGLPIRASAASALRAGDQPVAAAAAAAAAAAVAVAVAVAVEW